MSEQAPSVWDSTAAFVPRTDGPANAVVVTPPPAAPPAPPYRNPFAVRALVLGIVSIVVSPIFSLSILAITSGFRGMRDADRHGTFEGRAMAKAGFVLGIVSISLRIVVGVIIALVIAGARAEVAQHNAALLERDLYGEFSSQPQFADAKIACPAVEALEPGSSDDCIVTFANGRTVTLYGTVNDKDLVVFSTTPPQ